MKSVLNILATACGLVGEAFCWFTHSRLPLQLLGRGSQ